MSFLQTPRMTVESSNSSVVILTVFSAAAKVSFSQSSQNKMVVALSFDCLCLWLHKHAPQKYFTSFGFLDLQLELLTEVE